MEQDENCERPLARRTRRKRKKGKKGAGDSPAFLIKTASGRTPKATLRLFTTFNKIIKYLK